MPLEVVPSVVEDKLLAADNTELVLGEVEEAAMEVHKIQDQLDLVESKGSSS